MPRKSVIQYDPTLSIREIAEKSGVTTDAVWEYIKTNCIDRRFDRKMLLINKCRQFMRKNPHASKAAIHRATGVGVSSITKYWYYISNEKACVPTNPQKEQRRSKNISKILDTMSLKDIYAYLLLKQDWGLKAVDRNGKELWSEALMDVSKMIELADGEDLTKLNAFLFAEPEKPMLFIGSGGAQGSFPAFLYGMNKGVGIAMTPLQFASLSDEAIVNSRILLLSKGGKNDDIVYATKRAVKLNPENTACLTFSDTGKNRMIRQMRNTSATIILFEHPSIEDLFVSVRRKFYKYALFIRVFTGGRFVRPLINVNLDKASCFHYELNRSEEKPIGMQWIDHFVVLYGSFGQPVAFDIESVMAESGIASVQAVDIRNHAHGRFIFLSNHTENDEEPRYYSNAAVLFLVSPRERSLVNQTRKLAIPAKTPIIIVETEHDSPLASLDLLIKSSVLISYLSETCKKVNPCSPQNYSKVDKRFPIGGMSFIKELQDRGELTYDERE